MTDQTYTQANENWLPIKGYQGYEVSDFGRVRSCLHRQKGFGTISKPMPTKGWKILIKNKRQHGQIYLCGNGKRDCKCVHSLVLESFIGPRPEGFVCCHNNGNPDDNRLSNLRCDTISSNELDKIKHGVACVGEKNSNSKLKTQDIISIKNMYKNGISQSKIASIFKVSEGAIWGVINGRTWKQVTEEL